MNYNVVSMKGSDFHRYFDDEKFLQNAMNQSAGYLIKYEKSGECALPSFVLKTDDNSSYPAIYQCAKQPNEEDDNWHYEIAVFMPLYKMSEDGDAQFETVLFRVNEEKVDGKVIGLGVDVDLPLESKAWERFNATHFSELPPVLIHKITQKAMPLICIFANVQKRAFKSGNKVIKSQRRNHETTVRQGDYRDTKSVIKLSGSMTLSIESFKKSEVPKEIVRHCEAWGVRGHYRHYKNGNVVYIAPYIKGKGRLKKKEYLV